MISWGPRARLADLRRISVKKQSIWLCRVCGPTMLGIGKKAICDVDIERDTREGPSPCYM